MQNVRGGTLKDNELGSIFLNGRRTCSRAGVWNNQCGTCNNKRKYQNSLDNLNKWENKAKLQSATITPTLALLFDFLSFVFVTFWLFGVFRVVFTNHDLLPIFLCAKCCNGKVFADIVTEYPTICPMSIHQAQRLYQKCGQSQQWVRLPSVSTPPSVDSCSVCNYQHVWRTTMLCREWRGQTSLCPALCSS